jgi:hypothetical protein
MDFSRHISKLLFTHDCVIVPGLGGFVGNYQPTRVNKLQHQFFPPRKQILFNPALTQNDGLLANEIATNEAMGYEEALQEILAFSRDTLRALEQSRPVIFKNIGTFAGEADGTLQFTQDHTINYLTDAYGMTSIMSPAVRTNGKSNKPVFKDRKTPIAQRRISVTRVAVAAVVVVLIGMVGFNFKETRQLVSDQWSQLAMIYNNTNDASEKTQEPLKLIAPVSNAAFGVSFPTTDQRDPEVAEILTHLLKELPPIDHYPKPSEDNIAAPVTTQKSPTPDVSNGQRMYHLIAGSYERSVNAAELIDSYSQKGFSPVVIGPAENGRYRVSIVAYLRKEDALAALYEARQKYNPNIWLLRH